jgi:hypothetical protein
MEGDGLASIDVYLASVFTWHAWLCLLSHCTHITRTTTHPPTRVPNSLDNKVMIWAVAEGVAQRRRMLSPIHTLEGHEGCVVVPPRVVLVTLT